MLGVLALIPTFGPLVATMVGVWSGALSLDPALSATEVCRALEHAVSEGTGVSYYPGVAEMPVDIVRWSNPTTHLSACAVEPANEQDLSTVLRLVGTARMSFAVIGAAENPHPGVYSGKGVHISMKKFNAASYDNSSSTVTVGSGLSWKDVTSVLEPHGVAVAGTRSANLGLDNAWLPNQRSQARKALVSCELILPSGKIRKVSEKSDADLFYALKGGANDYGIVSKFTLKTSPATESAFEEALRSTQDAVSAGEANGTGNDANVHQVLTGASEEEIDSARLRSLRRRLDPWRVMDLASVSTL